METANSTQFATASILYLAKIEVIVHLINLDPIEGDLQAESVHHILLDDMIEIASACSVRKFKRMTNSEPVAKYNKATNENQERVSCRQRKITISEADGRDLKLLVGPRR
jgi:hypothetical protein